jgi:hypothetical protein
MVLHKGQNEHLRSNIKVVATSSVYLSKQKEGTGVRRDRAQDNHNNTRILDNAQEKVQRWRPLQIVRYLSCNEEASHCLP